MTWCFVPSFNLPKGQLSFVDRWPLMNPSEVAFILTTYLLFVIKIGPVLMEGRQPYQIKGFLVIYNAVKIINSTILMFKFIVYIMDNGLFPRKCEYDEDVVYTIGVLYWKYMVTKVLDLFDTIFFILRKKYSQVTFLHVYHHTFMVFITWSSLKYDPSDHWAFMAVTNCAIHTIMYAYYGISALGPRFSRYLWWKKYLTLMQMVQFVLIILHVMVQTYTSQCPMHASTFWVGLSNVTLFICLFADFYNKRYKASLARAKDHTPAPVEFACTRQASD